MSFAWPIVLWALLVPVGLLVWELTHRRRTAGLTRPKILRAEAGSHSLTLSPAVASSAGARTRIRYWLFAGLTLAIFAMARPQYGRLEEPVFDQSREILLAIDLSRSMLAPDVKPSRLERSKLLIQSLLEKLEGERVGLAVFAGTSFLQSPLSADYEILREFLPALGPEFLPEGGSNYGSLLDTAVQAFGNSNAADRFLIILSDGEATDADWKARIEKLKEKNVRVIGLGIGTPGGAMIPEEGGGFVKDERGAVVLSKLESATLQELATATGGIYRDASGWIDLAGLVKETVEAGQKGQFLEKNTIRLADRFQWPLALGLWCLIVSFYIEFPVRPRPRDIKLTMASPTPAPVPVKAAASLVLVALLAFGTPHKTQAATLAKAPARVAESDPDPATTPPPPPYTGISKIMGRLATSPNQTARDWAELGRETLSWGSRLQSDKAPIPEGPVQDALAGLELGAKLDPKTADWPKLREELEALLKKSDEQKQEQDKQDQKDQQDQQNQQDKDKQDKDQKNQDQKKSDSKQKQDSQDQKDPQQQNDKKDQQDQNQPDDKQKQGESAFGDMKKNEQPPQPPEPVSEETQKVGGTPEKKEQDQQPADPTLAPTLQKLEQVRNQDSPAKLFQLMEGEKKTGPKTKGKDW